MRATASHAKRDPALVAHGPGDDLGLRAKNRRQVREALVDSALALFRERAFDEVTVDDIARRAGVSRRTFFRHFATKEDVVMERRRRQLADFAAFLANEREGGALEAVRRACLALAEDFENKRERVLRERALVTGHRDLTARDLEVDRELEQLIVEAFAEREQRGDKRRGPPSIEARWMAAAIVGIVRVTLNDWAEGGGRAKLSEMGARAFALLSRLEPGARRHGG